MSRPLKAAAWPPPPTGFALVVSVLLLLALSILAAGMVALGGREVLIAEQMTRLHQRRLDAESAARAAAAAWSTRARLEAVAAGTDTADLDPHPALEVRAERLAPGLFLLRSTARSGTDGHPAVSASAALLLHALEPAALLAAFPAALSAAGPAHVVGGVISGDDACRSGTDLPPLQGEDIVVGDGATLLGGPVLRAPLPGLPVPDPFSEPLLGTVADIRIGGGHLDPRPQVRLGQCEPLPDNWGALAATSPCHSLLPLVHAAGTLRVESGEGRGILVVDGDLVLGGDFRFEGLVVVRGRLTLRDYARVHGAVRVDEATIEGGRVQYAACHASDAASAPSLDRAFRPARRWWVPP